MRPKTEITEDMVGRYAAELNRVIWINQWAGPDAIRAGLDAALNGERRKSDRRQAGDWIEGPKVRFNREPPKDKPLTEDEIAALLGDMEGKSLDGQTFSRTWSMQAGSSVDAPQGANKEQGCRHEWAILCFNPLAWPKDAPQVRCSKCGVVQSRRASDRNLSTGTDGDASPAPQATRNCPRGIYCGWGLCRHTAHCPYAGHV